MKVNASREEIIDELQRWLDMTEDSAVFISEFLNYDTLEECLSTTIEHLKESK